MGGTTIVVYGKSQEEVLRKLKEQVLIGSDLGLYPDSSAVLISSEEKAKLFDVSDDGDFTEVEKGIIFHVGVAARFHKAPEQGEILGTLHMHT